jgi:hypothetical protein
MFEIQFEPRIRGREINAERAITRASQVKMANHNRTQKRRIDLVDVNNEAFLPGSPPNPQANAIGNSKWRKPNRQQRREQYQKNNEKESIPKRHQAEG